MSLPSLKKNTPREQWDPITTPNGEQLGAYAYERADGRRHIYFWRDGQDIRGKELSRDVTGISYRVWPDGVQFAGMTIEKTLRGCGMARRLLEYFMQACEQREGPFQGTGIIHKPLIALALVKAGLQPMSEDCLVEILPKSVYDSSEVPKVHIAHKAPGSQPLVDHAPGGRFFDVVDPFEVRARYPIGSPAMTVAINTQYAPATQTNWTARS